MVDSLDEIHFWVETLIMTAGETVRKMLNTNLEIETKKHAHDFVTNIDKEIETFLVASIRERYPTHLIIGEEGTNSEHDFRKGIVWGIDPIDGTANLVYKQQDFAISIGIYVEGIGELAYIYDVMSDDFYHAKKGAGAYINHVKVKSRKDRLLEDSLIYARFNDIHLDKYSINNVIALSRGLGHMECASLGFVELGKGTIDGILSKGDMKFWDMAAGKLFAEECGVIFQGVDGSAYELGEAKDIIGAGPKLAKEMREKLRLI